MADSSQISTLIPPVYPRESPLRRMLVITCLAALTFGAMWLFR